MAQSVGLFLQLSQFSGQQTITKQEFQLRGVHLAMCHGHLPLWKDVLRGSREVQQVGWVSSSLAVESRLCTSPPNSVQWYPEGSLKAAMVWVFAPVEISKHCRFPCRGLSSWRSSWLLGVSLEEQRLSSRLCHVFCCGKDKVVKQWVMSAVSSNLLGF